MRRGVLLLLLCVGVFAAFGARSARADGSGTTTTATTTTASSVPLPPSSLAGGCIGAGAAAVVLPAHPVIALGSPASSLGPSDYATSSGTILSFGSSVSSGSACASARVTLRSLSLFDGAVSASSVRAADGRGAVAGLEIDAAAVTAAPGQMVPVDGWGELTLGATVGRITAPLIVRLLQAHDSLPAGTVVAVAFAASPRPTAKPKHRQAVRTSRPVKHSTAAKPKPLESKRRRAKSRGYSYWAHYTFPDGGIPPSARKNAVVALALHYLGVRYTWAGARPKTGFDCSGLVQFVFAKVGVWLPHNAAAQWHSPDTVWVGPRRLRPGDLVFFKSDGTRRMPGHVGIYIGGGDIVDAPHTGARVRVDSFGERWFVRQFVGAKHVVGVRLARGGGLPTATLESLTSLASQRHHLARRLFALDKAASSASAIPLHRRMPLGLGFAAAAPVIASSAPIRNGASSPLGKMGLGLGGVLLLLLAGAFAYRRREHADAPAAGSER